MATLACGASYSRVSLVDTPDLVVMLRSEKGGAARFAHPAQIEPERAVAVLASLDVRESAGDENTRRPALAPALARKLGPVLADALARADATQEVSLRALRRERKLGVFSRNFATRFIAFVDSEQRLQIHLVDADRELAAGEDTQLADPVATQSTHAIRTVPSAHAQVLGQRAVAVDFRAADFARAPSEREAGRGRTTILMDAPGSLAPVKRVPSELPSDPARLRALAELEEARRAGTISEAEYQRRRAELAQAEGS
ncbi:MAG: SHOCT domain-containing protein [Deltaproteobacteria bacterium]|nr:SHOCT domain-containing protein [Deltaproteobacteria bacterium]